MINSYFSIPYEDAKKFIVNLNNKQKENLMLKYNISESVVSEGRELSCEDQLAESVSDEELIDLGFDFNDLSYSDVEDDEEFDAEFEASCDEVIDFLITLDEDGLSDLMKQYEARTVEDLAIAITDFELGSLGFDNVIATDESFYDYDFIEEKPCYMGYDEELDFLEDIPHDVSYKLIDKDNYIFSADSELDFNKIKQSLDPNLVQYCEYLGDIVDIEGYLFRVVPITYQEEISEDVVINDNLNSNIFDENGNMLSNVRTDILNYVDDLIKQLNSEDIQLNVSDIRLVGSNAGYIYKPDSDIDIHLILETPLDPDIFTAIRAKLYDYTINFPLVFGESAVELNIEDGFNMESNSARMYSLTNDSWVDNSDQNEVYTVDDIKTVDGYEDVVSDYEQKIDDVISADEYADAVILKQEIRQNRSDDLANVGALSMGNVVFKELRDNGYYGKLREYINQKEAEMNNE